MKRVRTFILNALPFLIPLAPAFFVGSLIGTYPGYKTYEYVWKDARFCTSCHLHDYANTGWARSAHGKMTTCHDCHHQPLHEYMRELYVLVVHRPKFPKDLHHTPHVPKDLCQACHVSKPEDQSTITGPLSGRDIARLPKVDQFKLHHLHLKQNVELPLPTELKVEGSTKFGDSKEDPEMHATYPKRLITCMDCHGGPPNRGHNFTATDRSCTHCHQKQHKQGILKETGCRSCHFQEFMTPLTIPKH